MESWLNQPFDADTLPAGPETDWRLLHHVLDWKPGATALGQRAYVFPGGQADTLWPVSTSPSHAEIVAAMLRERGLSVEVRPGAASGFLAGIAGPDGAVQAEADTAPLAFARAALKGVLACVIVKR